MTTPQLRVAPIVLTPNVAGWRAILDSLGATTVIDSPSRITYQSGAGQVTLWPAARATTRLWFEAVTPEATAAAMASSWGDTTPRPLDHDPLSHQISFPTDVITGVSPLSPAGKATDEALAVFPVWHTPNLQLAKQSLTAAGARLRITSDAGGWADFRCDDGILAVHPGPTARIELAFEYSGDLAALAQRLQASGLEVRTIDETFGRTLRLNHPDHGPEIWINSTQDDLYGYTQHGE